MTKQQEPLKYTFTSSVSDYSYWNLIEEAVKIKNNKIHKVNPKNSFIFMSLWEIKYLNKNSLRQKRLLHDKTPVNIFPISTERTHQVGGHLTEICIYTVSLQLVHMSYF